MGVGEAAGFKSAQMLMAMFRYIHDMTSMEEVVMRRAGEGWRTPSAFELECREYEAKLRRIVSFAFS